MSHIITNTIRHEKPLNMTTYLITRNVTTHVDNHDGCGGCVHISIHSYCNTMHHICITNIEESCTCKLAATLYIAQCRWIIELTDRCSLVHPHVFYNHKIAVALIFWNFQQKWKYQIFSGSRKIWFKFEPDFSGTRKNLVFSFLLKIPKYQSNCNFVIVKNMRVD